MNLLIVGVEELDIVRVVDLLITLDLHVGHRHTMPKRDFAPPITCRFVHTQVMTDAVTVGKVTRASSHWPIS